ncbi:aromatic ring-hydroxylating dioxygenase subunit alpha [Nocardia sp. BMG51109]|uniref:aromatic ring-hydroxylating oxygenase subunit alpha n=1 Tax=Nocardia sp. BMG51109 TaxID=1056816 RepID=UPI000466723A|nr:aromatic ring-hydroxylating dioxygenase subunit alpha [Nocardia sp. BMG51109]
MTAPPKPITSLESPGCTDDVLLDDWHVVASSAEISYGDLYATTLLERDLVVWRDREGDLHAWEDLCVHRGARLSEGFVKDNRVVCPYHGWNYDGSARCVFMPASPRETPMKKARAITHHVRERYGLVWVCLGEPRGEIADFPEWEDAAYKKVVCGPYRFRSAYRALENFVDATHFPFVHAGVNGIADEPDPIAPYEVTVDDAEGLSTTEVRVTQPYGDPREIPVIAYYAYRIMRPFVAYFKKRVVIDDPEQAHRGNDADRFVTYFTAQPVDQTTSIVRICCAMNFDPLPTDDEVRKRQDLVYAQDSAIVDTQRPERIPVELRYELHHRSDLLGQKYRSWLRAKGVTYGAFGNH